jgi:oligoribonuclease (3'-5' exoribonuclease)
MLRSDRLAGELHYQFRRWELWNGPDVYLAGRSVHFDRAWAETHFPTAFQYVRLSHRHFDMTAIKAFVALADFAFGVPEDAHRALADVQADIALARQLVELVGGKPRLLINVEEPSSP